MCFCSCRTAFVIHGSYRLCSLHYDICLESVLPLFNGKLCVVRARWVHVHVHVHVCALENSSLIIVLSPSQFCINRDVAASRHKSQTGV